MQPGEQKPSKDGALLQMRLFSHFETWYTMAMKRGYLLQSLVLFGGTIFAWTTVANDFRRFYAIEGTIFKVQDCAIPNPVTTPCFYGAFAFLVAFVWSVILLKKDGEEQTRGERKLRWLLLASTLFAWGNFSRTLYTFYSTPPAAEKVGCSGQLVSSPFVTPCFYGSMIFLIALVLSFVLLRRRGESSYDVPQSSGRGPETRA